MFLTMRLSETVIYSTLSSFLVSMEKSCALSINALKCLRYKPLANELISPTKKENRLTGAWLCPIQLYSTAFQLLPGSREASRSCDVARYLGVYDELLLWWEKWRSMSCSTAQQANLQLFVRSWYPLKVWLFENHKCSSFIRNSYSLFS